MAAAHDRPDTVTSCCGAVTRGREDAPAFDEAAAVADASGRPVPTLRALPGGVFMMGSAEPHYPADHEGPPRSVRVAGFRIAEHAVSNDEFAAFVVATGYVTTAEREGWSFVFGGLLPDGFPPTRAVAAAPWWRQVPGASWHGPRAAPRTSISGEITPSSTCRGSTRGPTAGGREGGYQAKPNGSTPRAADSTAPATPGVTN